jgi:hypothetical protein
MFNTQGKNEALQQFYEGDLKLEVLPFDFTMDEENQIINILCR